ncbi:hypothetical protein MOV08_02085 [Streptomyces yunnanensis]|uniref:Uncharacterized protein n=1 Tax=Streptomyces yunnanensis TaxID=156453 RepID=A0ABY7ZZW9_9ACTN|nr:hypothetical protein [Streptomyces yunnanensis]WEB38213.1 hypothetical protein MOV08_02085 [Streptomyces yunnanensis]
MGTGPDGAFVRTSREFAHQRPPQDGRPHPTLPAGKKNLVTEAGWGVSPPVQNTGLVFGPCDRGEQEALGRILHSSYDPDGALTPAVRLPQTSKHARTAQRMSPALPEEQ